MKEKKPKGTKSPQGDKKEEAEPPHLKLELEDSESEGDGSSRISKPDEEDATSARQNRVEEALAKLVGLLDPKG